MRYWTAEEASEYLPRVRELLEVVQTAVARSVAARSNGHSGGSHGRKEAVGVEQALAELAGADIMVRDPVAGLIDFPARGPDEVEYYLCWRLDDEELSWWHLPEEGFAGRKPLPRLPGSGGGSKGGGQ